MNRLSLTTCFLLVALLLSSFAPAAAPDPAQVQTAPLNQASPKDQGGPESQAALQALSTPNPGLPSGILQIPPLTFSPKLTGTCDAYVQAGASKQTFLDGNNITATVYLAFNGVTLFVCMVSPQGTSKKDFASLYLDPQGDGASYVYANKGDIALHLQYADGSPSSYRGSGVPNGYVLDPTLDPLWSGMVKVSAVANIQSAEFQVDYGRLFESCKIFGIAVYHHWFSAVGDDHGWPSNQWFDQPRTWQLASIPAPGCGQQSLGRIAYVFRGNTADAASFFNLLTGAGYTVTLVPLNAVLATNFSVFDLIIIADDTGSLNSWGIPAFSAAEVSQIHLANKPTIGLGEGGYAYFGKLLLFIGWPQGWHGPEQNFHIATTAPPPIFGALADPVTAYSVPFNSVGIYLGPTSSSYPSDVVPIGLEDPTTDHSSLILQAGGCSTLWGNSGNPLIMSPNGKTVFLNTVQYMRVFQCPPPVTNDPCLKIEKTSTPPAGSTVTPGDVISYTITYTFKNDPAACPTRKEGYLLDQVPQHTDFIPGSASGGITPNASGALVWPIFPAVTTQTKVFKVRVDESACREGGQIHNQASLQVGGPPLLSPVISHPILCQNIGLPTGNPLFAEDEIEIHPYPLVTGQPSTIKVRVSNNTAVPQPVTVAFQTSPNRFGIGLTFSSFDTKTALIPPFGQVILQTSFTPVSSGHYCIQIVVTGPGLNKPLLTQRNIDVTEDLQPGVKDSLTFKVQNNSSGVATINLVVINTCPGWTATVTPASLPGLAPGAIVTATLDVTPPNPAVLGTGCHIDVQGWIGTVLIGGIRKLDVPPVNLPVDVNPFWEEPEISVIPDPPVVGQKGQICVALQNPLSSPRKVTLDYAVADFGAGLPFTTVQTQTVTLPPFTPLTKYCIDWTPALGGSLHRCVLVTLTVPGFQPMHSQHNVNLVRTTLGGLGGINIPFTVFNPDFISHTLQISPTVIGINPIWKPKIVINPGDPPPDMIMPGQMLMLHLMFTPATASAPQAAPDADYLMGDLAQVQINVLQDGVSTGGMTVQLETGRIYMPVVQRQ